MPHRQKEQLQKQLMQKQRKQQSQLRKNLLQRGCIVKPNVISELLSLSSLFRRHPMWVISNMRLVFHISCIVL